MVHVLRSVIMSPTATQRPVPIRPSPAKCLLTNSKAMMCFAVNTNSSPTTLTPPRTGAKRKFEDFDDDDDCSSPESVSCKRKINFASNNNNNSCPMSHPPAAVARRNARERNRVKQVNNGFATLRQHIPGAAKAKKISKVETLKQAVDYIRSLQLLLDENDYGMQTPVNNSSSHPQQQLNNSVPVTSYDYTTTTTIVPMNNNTYSQTKMPQYPAYYYSENVSPVCTSVYSQSVPAHSPACSDGATSSPSPSYISDTNSHLGSVEPAPITVLPDDINHTLFLTADAFTANFGMQYLDRYEEEDFIETCIENWEAK